MPRWPNIEDRFWASVEPANGCWEWARVRDLKGYGYFKIGNRRRRAHRVAWEYRFGPIPPGQCVLHRCDNPPCVNPDHLFLGSIKDNTLDAVAKGRHARGETHAAAKITEADVRSIRERARRGEPTDAIARTYGLAQCSVINIVARRKWKHVT